MTAGGITFDFHNTIAACDTWFQIEVRHLVSAFLKWDAASRGKSLKPGLTEAADAAYRRLRTAIHVHGHELPSERCVATVLDQMGILVDNVAVSRGVDEVMRASLDEATPMPGALETIKSLANDGVTLGIVSSAVHHPFLEWTLERFGIRDAFQVVTTSASVGYYKSRPEIYWETLRRLGATATSSVHVGDSMRFDVGGAQRAGMKTVLISASHNHAEPTESVPDLVVPTLQDAAPRILGVLHSR